MRKLTGIILFSLVIVGLSYLGWRDVPNLLTRAISHELGVSVTVKKMLFNKSGVVIKDLHIGNPKGYKGKTALEIETITVTGSYFSYFKNPVVIDEIHLDNAYVNIELKDEKKTEGNWQAIVSHTDSKKDPAEKGKASIIKKLLLTNIQIDLTLASGDLNHLSPIKRLEFENIDTEKGFPVQKITAIIFRKMFLTILFKKGLGSIINTPLDIVKGILSPFID